ncbi:MAG: hypothetical protein CM15mP130_1050 [Verrucomicrobiota bacterium]|nr:MAG: hypothetical protein CM15mP130_1050 [Verrucomicrobiota bacterium]
MFSRTCPWIKEPEGGKEISPRGRSINPGNLPRKKFIKKRTFKPNGFGQVGVPKFPKGKGFGLPIDG